MNWFLIALVVYVVLVIGVCCWAAFSDVSDQKPADASSELSAIAAVVVTDDWMDD